MGATRGVLHGECGTLVHLDAVVELTGAAALLAPLAGRAIERGVDDNFGELKRLLEATAEMG